MRHVITYKNMKKVKNYQTVTQKSKVVALSYEIQRC